MWDTIVIGSRIGGLMAAAALARCGQRVLVLEQHRVAGALTQTFQRHDWQQHFVRSPDDAMYGIEMNFPGLLGPMLAAMAVTAVIGEASIVPGMQRWTDLTLIHRGERFTIDGVGVTPEYQHTVSDEREQRNDLPAALAAYEAARRPVIDKLVAGANRSADGYEQFPAHMRNAPWPMAWSYTQRSGRVDAGKRRPVSPRFVAGCEARGLV